jgi:hypothetical protein
MDFDGKYLVSFILLSLSSDIAEIILPSIINAAPES